jgi:hydroxyacylglutathione hydrolase
VEEIADGLYLLRGRPKYGFNVYLMGDVIVDAATKRAGRRILRQVRDRSVSAHAITHAHADHQGASAQICDALGIPLFCPEGEADAMESGAFGQLAPDGMITRWQLRHWAGPAHPVAHRLREGDPARWLNGNPNTGTLARPRLVLARARPNPRARRRAVRSGSAPVAAWSP